MDKIFPEQTVLTLKSGERERERERWDSTYTVI